MTDESLPSYSASVKSDISDELINTYILRPIAHLFVRLVYRTRITPNQVTIASIVAGCVAALLFAVSGPVLTPVAGVCVTIKDLLDSADGQLARAKKMYSRVGRFLDSLGDLLVNVLVFAAISIALYRVSGSLLVLCAGAAGFAGISLRVSYHVFYQTSFLHLRSAYEINRISEAIRKSDLEGDPRALRLQQLFLVFYGWQDTLMMLLDRWSAGGVPHSMMGEWYSDRLALRLSGFLGLGTELFALMVFAVMNRLEWYLAVNIVAFNALWLGCVLYRKMILAARLTHAAP